MARRRRRKAPKGQMIRAPRPAVFSPARMAPRPPAPIVVSTPAAPVVRAGRLARLRSAALRARDRVRSVNVAWGYVAAGAVGGHVVRGHFLDPWAAARSEQTATLAKWAWFGASGVMAWRSRAKTTRSIAAGVFAEAAGAALLDAISPQWWVEYTAGRRARYQFAGGGGGGSGGGMQRISNQGAFQLPGPPAGQRRQGQQQRTPVQARRRATIAGYDDVADYED